MATIAGSLANIRGVAIPDLQKALFFGTCGAAGAFAGELLFEPFHVQPGEPSFERAVEGGFWMAAIGAGTALAIALGLLRYFKTRIATDPRTAATVAVTAAAGMAGAFIGGFLGFPIYWAASIRTEDGYLLPPPEWVRILVWGLMATPLGVALGLRIPNLGLRRGTTGGGIGGILGGAAFVAAVAVLGGDVPARLAGAAAIGGLIGLMIVLADAALRDAWLEVVYGPGETKVISLGSQPVSVGSGSDSTVYVYGAPARAFVFRFDGGRILAEDAVTGRTEEMKPGETRRAGSVDLVVRAAIGAPSLPLSVTSGSTAKPAMRTPSVPADASGSAARTGVPSSSRASHTQPLSQRAAVPARKTSSGPLVLRMSHGSEVRLTAGQRMSGREIPGLEPGYAGGHVADAVAVPSQPGVIALRNLSRSDWKANLPDGSSRSICPGQAITATAGMRLGFGNTYGEIR
jgi:hypothetical protein